MHALKSSLLLAIALYSREVSADPVTLQFESPGDTFCIVADYGRDPAIPPAEGKEDWTWNERDTAWQVTENGFTQYDVRFSQNFQAELEGVQGAGWVNLYYSHSDYPHSTNFTYDAELNFYFSNGDRFQSFLGYGGLFEDYAGMGEIAWGSENSGVQPGWGGSLSRYKAGATPAVPESFMLTKITNGVAECPGKSRAWKYKLKNPKGNPSSRETAHTGIPE